MIDVHRHDGSPAGDLAAHELRLETLPQGDELDLGRDGARLRVRELGDGPARQRPQRPAPGLVEDRVQVAVIVRLEPVVHRLHGTAVVDLDISALADPVLAQGRQTQPHVGAQRGVGVGPAGVVEHDAVTRAEHDLAHRDLQIGATALQVGLAGAGEAGPRAIRGGPGEGAPDSGLVVGQGHGGFLPTPVRTGSGANGQRPVLPPSQPRREAPAGRREDSCRGPGLPGRSPSSTSTDDLDGPCPVPFALDEVAPEGLRTESCRCCPTSRASACMTTAAEPPRTPRLPGQLPPATPRGSGSLLLT